MNTTCHLCPVCVCFCVCVIDHPIPASQAMVTVLNNSLNKPKQDQTSFYAHNMVYVSTPCQERGVLHQIVGSQDQHANKNWTQSGLRFCENEGSKRTKINEKD